MAARPDRAPLQLRRARRFLQRLKEGTWNGHILEHVVLELMTLAGLPDGFGRTRETTHAAVIKLGGQQLPRGMHPAGPLDSAASWCWPRSRTCSTYRGDQAAAPQGQPRSTSARSTAAIVNAAEARKIPHIRLLDDGNLVQLGYGAAMRRIWTAETDSTSAIAEAHLAPTRTWPRN